MDGLIDRRASGRQNAYDNEWLIVVLGKAGTSQAVRKNDLGPHGITQSRCHL